MPLPSHTSPAVKFFVVIPRCVAELEEEIRMSDHDSHSHGGDHAHGGKPSDHPEADLHGMLVVGEVGVFLSHLPMFGHPHHDIQAILSAHFTRNGDDPQAEYAADRKQSGERIYTLEPEHFFLPDLVEHAPGEECLCEFQGSIYRGHFERGGTNFLPDVEVTVDRVIHFRQFKDEEAPLTELTYILFGADEEHFLAHMITRPPDFDQIISVQIAPGTIGEDELSLGPTVTVPGRENNIKQRLKAGEQATVLVAGMDRKMDLTVQTELYLEEGELGVTFSQETTPEERAADF
jgi:hypothetical protein